MIPGVITPIAALFAFTIRQTLLTRKIWMTLVLLAGPSALILLIRNVAPPIEGAEALWEAYHGPVQFLLVLVLLPLVCMVHGTALIGADVEARTIVYLLTRRMRRGTVLCVKFIATALVLAVLCDLAMISLHICALTGRNLPSLVAQAPAYANWNPQRDLGWYLLLIPAGVLGFLAVFTLIGLLSARPLALSALYLIAVELIVSNIPVQARIYSLLHQLRVTMAGVIPRLNRLFEMPPDLREELYPAGGTGLPELFGVVLVALVLSVVLVTLRELVPTKVSRE